MSNKKEKWDPFAGELMSIQDNLNGYYAEIPDLQESRWSSSYRQALDWALDTIEQHKGSGALDDLCWKRKALKDVMALRRETITDLHNQFNHLHDLVRLDEAKLDGISEEIKVASASDVDLSDELEIAEQADGIGGVLERFFDGTDKHRRIGINIYRDHDGDGDLDVSFSVTGSKKKFVK